VNDKGGVKTNPLGAVPQNRMRRTDVDTKQNSNLNVSDKKFEVSENGGLPIKTSPGSSFLSDS
jgi:hypothetical protein